MKNYKNIALFGAFAISFLFIYTQFLKPHTISDFQKVSEKLSVENNPATETKTDVSEVKKQKIAEEYGKLPINFEPNLGQTSDEVKFLARGKGYSLFLTDTQAVLSLEKRGKTKDEDKRAIVRMQIDGANTAPKSSGIGETGGKSNYFIGNDAEKWQTDVPNYEKVRYEAIYEGIDLVYYGNVQQLEYDFLVQPNADPQNIKLKFDGVKSAKIDNETGDLLLETEVGTIRQHKPFVYQEIDGERREIASSYSVQSPKSKVQSPFTVSFNLAEYDRSKELVIDPILAYGSYLGGNAFDQGGAIAVDAQGNAYIVGTAASRDFPTTAGTIKPAMLPATTGNQFWYDAFVTKINPTGTALVFSTYYGGRNGSELGTGVAVDSNGNVLISGTTAASDFPTVNAYQTTFGGTDDAFAAKLNSTGSAIIYSTYLGGNNTDTGGKIALNQTTGDAVFAGYSSSPNFPTTAGTYKQKLCNSPQTCNGIFYSGSYLVKLSANGNAVYSTLFDAGILDVTLDASDNAVFGGTASAGFPATAGAYQTVSSGGIEGFIAKINPSGNTLVYGTFLGGGLQSDRVKSIVLDSEQNIYVAGQTQNTAFPTTPGAFDVTYNGGEDGFVTKLNPAGSTLVYSTFLGGTGKDEPFAISLGADNSAFVVGETLSNATFPLRNSLLQTGSIFLTRLNPDASALVFSTLLGQGGAYDLVVDANNNAYLTGHTTNALVTPNAFQTTRGGEAAGASSTKDAFVMKVATTDENSTFYSISGTVTDQNAGFNNDYNPVVVTLTGTINRIVNISYTGGQFYFGSLLAGGNYTVTVKKIGYETAPQSINFNNLGANQSGDFTLLRNHAPEATITSPAHGAQFNAPASITIQASATDSDGDAISRVEFVAYNSATGNIPLGTDTTAPFEFTWTNVPVGTYGIYAFPVDSHGLRGQTQNVVQVMVIDPTGANVSINTPTEGQTFAEGDYIPLGVTVSSSVNVVEVRDQNNNLVGRMTASPWTTTWRVMNVGNYTLTATAFTQANQQGTSAPVHVTVNPINHRISGRITNSVNNNPLTGVTLNLVCPSNPNISAQTTTDSNGSYVFTGLGTTPNDSVTITPSLSGYNFTPPSRSTGFLGYITDWTNQNFTAVQQTQISVAMTSPTDGQTFTSPATINLAADASSGAGTITKVEFLSRNPNGTFDVLATDTTAPFEYQLTNVGAGNYTYFARATDSTNAVTSSEQVSVAVSLPTVSLSGRITNQAGNGVQGIEVYVSGAIAWSVTTDASGNFIFTNLPGGSNYYITPQPANTISFTPVSRSYTNVTSNISGIDFVASQPNQSPSPQFISPTNGGTYSISQPIPLNVVANDPDNNVTHFSVVANNGSSAITIAQTTANTINTLWQPTLPGNYVLTAIVRDAGPVQITTQISITVTQSAPVSISGRAIDRNSVGIEGATVELKDYATETNVIASAVTDANGNYTLSNIATFSNYVLRVSKQDYTFSPQKRVYLNLSANQTGVDFTGTLQVQPSDFDGDGISDIAVWRPSSGVWHIQRSGDNSYNSLQFGGAAFGDVAVPGNYDGDKKTDYAVYRNGLWYVWQSSNGQVRTAQFGVAGDKPIAGDYDGDGKTDFAVWRPSNGVWYIWRSSDGGYDFRQFGLNGDIPLSGDYDGDGKTDLTIWRPSTGVWYVWQSSDGNYRSYQFGTNGDIPLVGDFDGDKIADYTIFRPSTGVWYVNLSSNGDFKILQWGSSADIPVPGDFDRDGKTDFGVYRPSEGNWYIFKSSTNSYIIQHFGINGDMPIPAAYFQ
ncbi:hypothetical protein BH10ACI1_BH10ACI1_00090 [soil metagenome]